MIKELENIFNKCRLEQTDIALESIADLGYLVERHRVKNIISDRGLFSTNEAFFIKIESTEYNYIVYFLFFILFNYPDRSYLAAWALSKSHDRKIINGLKQAIQLYSKNSDDTTFYLVKAILDMLSYKEIDEALFTLLKTVKNIGLIKTNEFISEQFDFYKESYGFIE